MIRKAEPEDYPLLFSMQIACIKAITGVYSEQELLSWVGYIKKEGVDRYARYENYLISDDADAPVGFVSWLYDMNARRVSLECLYVLPAMRGRGVGVLLLGYFEAHMPEEAFISVRSTLNAEGFYLRYSYTKVGQAMSRAGFNVALLEKHARR
jgi:GNAT superfamily N-acetyltransferase